MRHSDGSIDDSGRRHADAPLAAPVQSATSAPPSAAEEQSRRVRRYLIAMSFRALCGVGAYFTMGWVRWTLVAAAVILPYIAVVLANAVGPRAGTELAAVETPVRTLDAQPDPYRFTDDIGGGATGTTRPTIHGTVVDGPAH